MMRESTLVAASRSSDRLTAQNDILSRVFSRTLDELFGFLNQFTIADKQRRPLVQRSRLNVQNLLRPI